jgi:hypothetical protein
LNAAGVAPYWSFCYLPIPFQGNEHGWRGAPADLAAWGGAAETFARHFRDTALPVGFYEVWNEPDYDEFFRGTREQYFAMYAAAASALRRGDPDAVVGGPALAYSWWWIEPFVAFVADGDLPLDFLSFHSIGGTQDDPPREQFALDLLRHAQRTLAGRPRFATTEIHLNEYHPYRSHEVAEAAGHALAARLLDNFALFLQQTDLTRVSWAQFMDPAHAPGYGLVGPNGELKAAYGAFAIYGDMPADRVQIDAAAPIECMASADASAACTVLWNASDDPHVVSVRLSNLQLRPERLSVFRIDADHTSVAVEGDRTMLRAVAVQAVEPGQPVLWTGLMPARSIVYLKVQSDEPPAATAPAGVPRGRLTKELHWFPRRGGDRYAYFDRRTASALLGSGTDGGADVALGLLLDDVDDVLRLRTVDRSDTGGALGHLLFRVDYAGPDGRYGNSVAVRAIGADDTPQVLLPWGTARRADETVDAEDMGDVTLDLAAHAPAGWAGRAIVTPLLRDAPPGTRLRVYLGATADHPAALP